MTFSNVTRDECKGFVNVIDLLLKLVLELTRNFGMFLINYFFTHPKEWQLDIYLFRRHIFLYRYHVNNLGIELVGRLVD